MKLLQQTDLTSCSPTCKLVDWRLWERVLIGRLSRLVLVLRGRSGQVSLQLLVLLPLLLLCRQTAFKTQLIILYFLLFC